MSFFHGIKSSELATSIKPSVQTGNLPVIVGTAPVNLANDPKINKPQILYTWAEVSEYFGYVDDIENYTLCEAFKVFFTLYGMAPICVINVLDPDVHKVLISDKSINIDKTNKELVMEMGVKRDTVVVKKGTTTLTLNVDYTSSFDSDGYLTINFVKGGGVLSEDGTTWSSDALIFTYEKIDPTLVDADDIIGGYDSETNTYEGLELINQCYALYRVVPTMLLAPKYGEDSSVAAVLETKASKVNTVFSAVAIVDIPESVVKYTDVPNKKNLNNLVSENLIVCWPKVKLGEYVYRLSTQLAGLMVSVDYDNNDVPRESPSNKNLKIDGVVTGSKASYKEVNLDLDQANYLNSNGIVTAFNFANGWTAWGNRTACYPANTDAKDSFISGKRIMKYYENKFILDNWVNVDKSITKSLVNNIVDSTNEMYNGEVSSENLLSGKVKFLSSENSKSNILSGIIQFHHYLTPGLPAEQIIGVNEIDVDGYDNLFS